ncbi:MAG: hypothetical protein P8X58_04010, partial [Syntrophobacterales bacterium]
HGLSSGHEPLSRTVVTVGNFDGVLLGTMEDSGENGPVTQVNPIEIPHSNHGAGKRLMTRGQAMVTHHFPHVRLRE